MKKIMKNSKPAPATGKLPRELVTEIISRVASSSVTDLFNAKISCKAFHEVAEDKYVMGRVCLDEFLELPWKLSAEASSFLDRCYECQNPETIFRRGMVEYFGLKNIAPAMENLRKAAELGHIEASYVLGIIFMCQGSETEKSLGQNLLRGVMTSKLKRRSECRKRLRTLLGRMWVKNKLKPTRQLPNCLWQHLRNKNPWISKEDQDFIDCDTCGPDYEVYTFCDMLQGH